MNKVPYPQVFDNLSITAKDNPYLNTKLKEIVIKPTSIDLILCATGFVADATCVTNKITTRQVTITVKKGGVNYHYNVTNEREIPCGRKMIVDDQHGNLFVFPTLELSKAIILLENSLVTNYDIADFDKPVHLTNNNNINISDLQLINNNIVSYSFNEFTDTINYLNQSMQYTKLSNQTIKVVKHYFTFGDDSNE